jgi:hypothetical protein
MDTYEIHNGLDKAKDLLNETSYPSEEAYQIAIDAIIDAMHIISNVNVIVAVDHGRVDQVKVIADYDNAIDECIKLQKQYGISPNEEERDSDENDVYLFSKEVD